MTELVVGGPVQWRVHLRSPPAAVYALLSTDSGRARFWAESAIERDGAIEFRFPNGAMWRGRILAQEPPRRFVVEYFGGSRAAFELAEDGRGGTDLTVTEDGVPQASWTEVKAGWVSVLMALKATVDYEVDLRNHDSGRTWDQRYVEN